MINSIKPVSFGCQDCGKEKFITGQDTTDDVQAAIQAAFEEARAAEEDLVPAGLLRPDQIKPRFPERQSFSGLYAAVPANAGASLNIEG